MSGACRKCLIESKRPSSVPPRPSSGPARRPTGSAEPSRAAEPEPAPPEPGPAPVEPDPEPTPPKAGTRADSPRCPSRDSTAGLTPGRRPRAILRARPRGGKLNLNQATYDDLRRKTAPISGVRLEDCTFDGVAKPDVLENVNGVELKNVRINGELKNGVISSR